MFVLAIGFTMSKDLGVDIIIGSRWPIRGILIVTLCASMFGIPYFVLSSFVFVENKMVCLLDLIFLDIYEIDATIAFTEPYNANYSQTIFHTGLHNHFKTDNGKSLRFSKGKIGEFDSELLAAGYTLDELREYMVGVHMLCLKKQENQLNILI